MLQDKNFSSIAKRLSSTPLNGSSLDFFEFAQKISRASTVQTGDPNQSKNGPNAFTGQDYLAALSARPDPLLSFEWVAFVVDPAGNQVSIPWYYIDTFQAPTLSIEASPVFRSGVVKNYAGSITCSSLTLGLYTDSSGAAIAFASKWYAAVFGSELGIYKVPGSYKKTVKLFLHDARRRVVCEFTFFGCFPASWSGYGLENSGSNPLVTTLEVNVDWLSIGEHQEEDFSSNVLSQGESLRRQSSASFANSPLSRIFARSSPL